MKKVSKEFADMPSLELAQLLSQAALDKKAENLVILDVKDISSFTDYFVIMSGRSTRHVQGLAEAVDSALSQKRIKDGNTEGLQEGLWVLLDYDDVVVHIFYKDVRDFYDLEGLWHDAPRIEVIEEGK
ncbi:MAG: ribosome silencing factor [Desulfobulbaceae bacterium]|uniref:Ribosomal silencing factor RsfS n=1 Tax=Candidatus Desulfobia pelagia TaxID=2841692 RepID=A0A8J6NB06_9BACT|nr:ribosome silencing factor [Candidatus Desulfobia pelagia]